MKKINPLAIFFLSILWISSISSCKEDDDNGACPATITDIDGNVYNTVTIGTQCWMKENLKASRYSNGSPIPEIEDSIVWANNYINGTQTPGWSYYGQNNSYNADYGKLYNWYAVKDSRNVCPTGWHVPTTDEWTTLTDYLGGEMVAGGKMKEIALWQNPNTDATNISGFSGRPGGYRDENAKFHDITGFGIWWSSTEYDSGFAWHRYMHYSNGVIDRDFDEENHGVSIRCIKD